MIPNTFDEWLQHLQEIAPGLDWDLMDDYIIDDLRKLFQEVKDDK